jgi:hypothetical protein
MSLELGCGGGLPYFATSRRPGNVNIASKTLLAAVQVHPDPLHASPEAIRNDYQQHEQDEREFRFRTCHAFYTPEQNDSGVQAAPIIKFGWMSIMLMPLFLFVYLFYPLFSS